MTLAEVLHRHDAGEPGWCVGDLRLMEELLRLLGWQGGTIHDAIREARLLVATEE